MLPLPRPKYSAEYTFKICIRNFHEPRASHLKAATSTIVCAANDFDNAATDTIHNIRCHDSVTPNVTKEGMKTVYERGMKRGDGREIYNDIVASSPLDGKCPLCMERDAETLDHYLPKSRFPSLAVAPLNLIPACFECNNIKGDIVARSADDVPLHPYYDNLGDDIWLDAYLIKSSPATLKFFIAKPDHWESRLHKRVENHFKSLKLARLFAVKAAQKLTEIRDDLREAGSANDVKKHLQDMLKKERCNSWQAVAYRVWSQCDWFCDGGFLQS